MQLPGNSLLLSNGFRIGVVMLEKSPFRHEASGTVGLSNCNTLLPRDVSKEKKKKLRLCPSYSFGMTMGPPTVPPGWWRTPAPRCGAKGLRARNQGVE